MQFYVGKKPSKYITYLDVNNLCCWAMSQYLPYGGFKWLSYEEINRFDVNAIEENSSNGYILQVGIEYSDELNDFHNDYPLAPEKFKINNDMLSKNCSDIAKKYGIKIGGINKLVPNLGNKIK